MRLSTTAKFAFLLRSQLHATVRSVSMLSSVCTRKVSIAPLDRIWVPIGMCHIFSKACIYDIISAICHWAEKIGGLLAVD
eukprot:scaffold233037_cov22-Prasinocladus_malaysianus.AAC.1